ncbi:hypothetical protein [Sediminicoccus sp. BL-A-41-H5]
MIREGAGTEAVNHPPGEAWMIREGAGAEAVNHSAERREADPASPDHVLE